MHILLVVGRKKRGKTSLVERLVPEFKRRGYKVGSIKYTTLDHQFDTPGKDSFRHAQAGAETTLILSPKGIALFSSDLRKKSPDELFQLFFKGYDLIIGEGFKNSPYPKVEVLDSSKDVEPLCSENENLIALICDKTIDFYAPVFSLDQIKPLVDFLEKEIGVTRRE
ncbi:MAG: molybdopterin-guanine dinucleotide biosynthesis protein B [Candidatus Zixiibacteriota bacterium]